MKVSLSILLVVCFLLISCNPFNSTSEGLEAEISNKKLLIFNNFQHTIYYMAMDQDFVARANWVWASTEGNAIKPSKMKEISLARMGAADYSLGNKIVVYYWSSEKPDADEVNHILVW